MPKVSNTICRWSLLITASLLFVIGCSEVRDSKEAGQANTDQMLAIDGKSLTKVTLQLNWFPEAEHGGYYAALVHGFFAAEGLDVEIIPGGPGSPVIQKLVANQTMFVVGNADQVLTGRNQEAEVTALFAPIQMSPRCIMVHASSGIERLDELQNMTVALSAGRAFALYMQKKLSLEGVRVVGYPGSMSVFLNDKNFAQQGYVFSEPFIAKQQGGDPRVLMVSELGFNPYASLLITRSDTVDAKPELIAAMVRASKQGWQTYLESPEKTNAAIHQQNEEMGLEILNYGATVLKDLCLPAAMPATQLGNMTQQRWTQLRDQLAEIDLVDENLDVSKAFTIATGHE
ncbi:MAG: ABC transporter substrate-binding protein [Planctomycetaceae bacterium]|jgi:NitT/TauT family transport system substrate-binding protein|nr:ABC transporter substrate-binding protein [Planctomycetaceae bacterium]